MNEPLIARIWRTKVIVEKAEVYETFARQVSLPMFRQQQGFAGTLMLRRDGECQVITLWRSPADLEALDRSSSYRETVERILQQGFLQGEQTLEISNAHLFDCG